jgi:hypothetical protein
MLLATTYSRNKLGLVCLTVGNELLWSKPYSLAGLSKHDGWVIGSRRAKGRSFVEQIDASSGEVLRTLATGWNVLSLLAPSRFAAMSSADDGRFLAVWRLQDGAQKPEWIVSADRVQPRARFDVHVAADEQALYVGAGSRLVRVNVESGAIEWQVDLTAHGGPASSTTWKPVLVADTVVVNTADSTLGIERRTGRVLWRSARARGRASADGMVFLIDERWNLTALDAADGRAVYGVACEAAMCRMVGEAVARLSTQIAVAGNVLCAAELKGRFWAIDSRDGAVLWSVGPDGSVQFLGPAPTVVNSTILLSGSRGREGTALYCYSSMSAPSGSSGARSVTSKPLRRKRKPSAPRE